MPREGQLHSSFPAFPRWVIDKLVGILANDPPNVVVTMVGRWIDENEKYLKSRGISHEEWRKSLGPQGLVKSIREHEEDMSRPGRDDADSTGG